MFTFSNVGYLFCFSFPSFWYPILLDLFSIFQVISHSFSFQHPFYPVLHLIIFISSSCILISSWFLHHSFLTSCSSFYTWFLVHSSFYTWTNLIVLSLFLLKVPTLTLDFTHCCPIVRLLSHYHSYIHSTLFSHTFNSLYLFETVHRLSILT